MRVIFVRRGQFSTFKILVERCQLLDDVQVAWDRRIGPDRRYELHQISTDRRRAIDRRRPMALESDLRGYTVADLPQAPGAPA